MPEELWQRLFWILATGYWLLEAKAETQLELPLLVSGRARILIRVVRNRRNRVAGHVNRRRGGHVRQLLGVEHVLQLGDDFAARRAVNRDPARVAQVDVL